MDEKLQSDVKQNAFNMGGGASTTAHPAWVHEHPYLWFLHFVGDDVCRTYTGLYLVQLISRSAKYDPGWLTMAQDDIPGVRGHLGVQGSARGYKATPDAKKGDKTDK